MRRQAWFALFCTAALLAAGCSSGGGGSSLPAATATGAAKKGVAVFRIKVPRRQSRANRRHPDYISPATTSMALAITGPTPVAATIPLDPTTCTTTLSNLVCSLSETLAPGSYLASITLYDASSKVLSSGQNLAFVITAGASNSIGLTLSGVATNLVVTGTTALSPSNASGGIDLLAQGAHKLVITAQDADGNVIVGAGAPKYAIAETNGSLGVTLTQPSVHAPNTFAVTPPSAFSANTATLTVTASYAAPLSNGCAQAGAVCTTTVVVDMAEMLAVMTGSNVLIFQAGQSTAIANVSAGINDPQAIAFDPSGDLFVANCLRGCLNGSSLDSVVEFAPPYTGVPTFLTTGITAPQRLAVNASGDLFVANCGSCSLGTSDSVTEFAPPFSSTSAPIATITGVTDPKALQLDGTGNLFVANCATCGSSANPDSVMEFTPPYTGAAAATITTAVDAPVQLALDASNRLYVGNGTPSVTIYASPFPLATPTLLTNGIAAQPTSLGLDASSNLFVAVQGAKVLEYTQPILFSSTPAVTVSTVSTPAALVLDAFGNLYVANQGSSTVREYPSPYSGVSTVVVSTFTDALAILP